MCKTLVSVDYRGYDCDFNQMLGIPLVAADPPRVLRVLLRTLACARRDGTRGADPFPVCHGLMHGLSRT
jgi:hypothetical protein